MITLEELVSFEKEKLPEAAISLGSDSLGQLVAWLSEKDDKIRYQVFLLLQYRSAATDDVYPYWDVFCEKLKSENSYQRSIGLMLIAENTRWDRENRLDSIIEDYLLILKDEKPITVRQCIQSLLRILPYKRHMHEKIAEKLMALDLKTVRETMRKSVLMDILSVLTVIRKYGTSEELDSYIFNALNSGLLDKKSIKQIEALM